jgi:hypothetical protein
MQCTHADVEDGLRHLALEIRGLAALRLGDHLVSLQAVTRAVERRGTCQLYSNSGTRFAIHCFKRRWDGACAPATGIRPFAHCEHACCRVSPSRSTHSVHGAQQPISVQSETPSGERNRAPRSFTSWSSRQPAEHDHHSRTMICILLPRSFTQLRSARHTRPNFALSVYHPT